MNTPGLISALNIRSPVTGRKDRATAGKLALSKENRSVFLQRRTLNCNAGRVVKTGTLAPRHGAGSIRAAIARHSGSNESDQIAHSCANTSKGEMSMNRRHALKGLAALALCP